MRLSLLTTTTLGLIITTTALPTRPLIPLLAPQAANTNTTIVTLNTRVIPSSFGVVAGAGRDAVQVGSCTGANNAPIPCDCPPLPTDRQFLRALALNLAQGFFPDPSVPSPIDLARFNDAADTSAQTTKDRATAMVQALQSLSGTKGVGCPGVSYPVVVALQQTGVVGGVLEGVAGR